MDGITAELLMMMAGGAAGAAGQGAGQSAWQSLVALVRRRPVEGDPGQGTTGRRELEEFEADPENPVRAQGLADALVLRAGQDPEFARRLSGCLFGPGRTHMEVSGGQQNNVVQAQYVGTLHISGSNGPAAAG
ncbi:hypothetical protein ACWCOZ_07690 [Streptomyces sp. NPDC001840]|uniref:hypothetical protein n=1 Tax=Streptomyces sp. NPDC059396 TaxID=3346819 RepID=UPI003676DFA1